MNQRPPATGGHSSPGWHRTPSIQSEKSVRIEVDGQGLDAFEGECLATALAVSGILALRRSPGLDQPRGMFCLMGVCQECVVLVDDEALPACMESVRQGMRVSLQRLPPRDPAETQAS